MNKADLVALAVSSTRMMGMSYEKDPTWQEDAKCGSYPSEWFNVLDHDSPGMEGKSRRELLFLNLANYGLAEEVCIECPVFFQCKQDATEDDLKYTVRGGEKPTILTATNLCKSGRHELSEPGRCKECHAEIKARYRAEQRARRDMM